MVSNVVLTCLITGYVYLSFLFCILLVSFTFSHLKESSRTLLQGLQPLS